MDKISISDSPSIPSLRWYAVLSNGETAYEDDGRPDCSINSGWVRLGNYVKKHQIYISELYLQFRSHIEALPGGKYGYYLSKGAVGSFGMSHGCYWVGYIDGLSDNLDEYYQVRCFQFQVPELIVCDNEFRTVNRNDPRLILCQTVEATKAPIHQDIPQVDG